MKVEVDALVLGEFMALSHILISHMPQRLVEENMLGGYLEKFKRRYKELSHITPQYAGAILEDLKRRGI